MLVLHISKDSTIRNPANPAKLNPRRPLVIYGRSFSSGSKQPLKEGAIPPSNEAFKLAHKPRRGWNCASNEGMWREKDGETSLLISPFGNLHIGMSERILCVLRASSEAERTGGECLLLSVWVRG